ncbi:MAG: hypothetical protein LV479_07095, partial [Methylacidiphilales bacterium]|nr:hypothetical protein [Candidatus Methylacidiphilales bacterium]
MKKIAINGTFWLSSHFAGCFGHRGGNGLLMSYGFIAMAMIGLLPLEARAALIFEDTFDSVSGATRSLPATSRIADASSFTVKTNGELSDASGPIWTSGNPLRPFTITSFSYLNTFIASGAAGKPAVVTYAPASASNSWGALAGTTTVNGATYLTLNGGFDLYVCPNSFERGNVSWFRPIDINGISGAAGMRIVLSGTSDDRVQLRITTGAERGLGSAAGAFTSDDSFKLYGAIENAPSIFTAGTVVHLAVTFKTDAATGRITVKLFGVSGVAPINTESGTVGVENLQAMQTFYASAAAIGAKPLPTGSWTMVTTPSSISNVNVDYDTIRLYDNEPELFPSLGVLNRLPLPWKASFPVLPSGKNVPSTVFLERDTGIGLNATIANTPPNITLNWAAPDTGDVEWVGIYRKLPTDTAWTQLIASPALKRTALAWTDTSVKPETMYAYKIKRRINNAISPYGYGYCWAGISVPPVHSRGTAILVIESSVAKPLAKEIATLISDLNGDGWIVKQHIVDARPVDTRDYAEAVVNVRKMIQADYRANPSVDAVILVGHVPVPYSGAVTLDGHDFHVGAWPADSYYGDMTGTWTDTNVNINVSHPWNRNVPGDGKFDQNSSPAPVELQVGRVDMSNLPDFTQANETAPATEVRLLRKYLDRDHRWRQGQVKVARRGVVMDFWLDGGGTSPWGWVMSSSDGWRNLVTDVGRSQVVAFIPTDDGSEDYEGKRPGLVRALLSKQDYLWAFGSSWGRLDYANDISSTPLLAKLNCQCVFLLLYASGIADWDCANNLLRAHLAADGLTLSAMYSETPHVYMFPMGMGGTLGECVRLSMNN